MIVWSFTLRIMQYLALFTHLRVSTLNQLNVHRHTCRQDNGTKELWWKRCSHYRSCPVHIALVIKVTYSPYQCANLSVSVYPCMICTPTASSRRCSTLAALTPPCGTTRASTRYLVFLWDTCIPDAYPGRVQDNGCIALMPC